MIRLNNGIFSFFCQGFSGPETNLVDPAKSQGARISSSKFLQVFAYRKRNDFAMMNAASELDFSLAFPVTGLVQECRVG